MKRDMDLLREIMLRIESEHDGTAIYGFMVPDKPLAEVAYHCQLLYEHGFISDYNCNFGDDEPIDIAVGGLTWEGCEYLEEVRDNGLWKKVKAIAKEKGLPLAVEMVKTIVEAIVNTEVTRYLGS